VSESYPKSRRRGLRTEMLLDELLVYDLSKQKAYCLNAAAMAVYELADGTRTVEEIAHHLALRSELPADADLVRFTLEQLDRQGLLETNGGFFGAAAPTRRQLLARLGVAAAVLPAILSISLPRPAAAQSPGPTGATGPTGPG
jgi:hypothetical protein